MTTPKAATTKKIVKQPTCKNPDCKVRFRTSSPTAKYCSDICRAVMNNAKKKVDPIQKAMGCAFFYWIAGECARAGTYQILIGHTVESLVELHQLHLLLHKANDYSTSKKYHCSHIAPVKGGNSIGLLFAENIVVAPAAMNLAHGTKYYGCGRYISRAHLQPQHNIPKGANLKQVRLSAIEYLGKDLVAQTIKVAKIKPTRTSQDRAWLARHLDISIEEHRAIFETLDSLKSKQLSEVRAMVKAHLTGQPLKPVRGPSRTGSLYHPLETLLTEWERLSEYRPEILPHLELFKATNGGNTNEGHLQTIFDLLHGKSPSQLEHQLAELIHDHTVVIRYFGSEFGADDGSGTYGYEIMPQVPYVYPDAQPAVEPAEYIPAYAPIVFNVNKPAPSASLLATPFADTLDDECHVDTSLFRVPAWEAQDDAPPF
jgi:hypothetical protein